MNRGLSDEDEDSTSDVGKYFIDNEEEERVDINMQENDDDNQLTHQQPQQTHPEGILTRSNPMGADERLPSFEEMEALKKTNPLEYVKLFKARRGPLA